MPSASTHPQDSMPSPVYAPPLRPLTLTQVLGSPETAPAASVHLHSCPPLQRKGLKSPAWDRPFPSHPPRPGPPYPHSRGNQAHVLPGRSEAQTDTSPPPPPIDCKWRLVGTKRSPSASSPCQIPAHQPPDTSPSSSWEEASSHCLTALSPSSTMTRGYLGTEWNHVTPQPPHWCEP